MPFCTCTDAGSLKVAEDPACTRPGTAELVPIATQPVVGETPAAALRSWLTPTPLFYVRNHYDVPEIDPTTWSLSIDGAVSNPVEISYSDLLRLPKKTLPAMLECAGNNRSDLGPGIPGNPFDEGAMSNAIWAGAPLKPFLQQAGISPDAVEVLFEGDDRGEPVPGRDIVPYQRSLPLQVALHPDTMLVYEMSGETLPPDHGFPVRLIVPRWYGMASVKWLTRIRVLEKPFVGFFQTERYVMEDEAGIDQQISRMEVKSFVNWPEHGTSLPIGRPVAISGMAWSGDGLIRRVDVSLDGGETWQDAHLDESALKYSWQQWHVDWTPMNEGHYTIIARAADDSGNLQPLETRWNKLGYCVNGSKPVCITAV